MPIYLRRLLSTIALFFFCLAASAQEGSLRLRFTDGSNQPLGFVSVKMIPASDTTRLIQAGSDSSGNARFTLPQPGNYTLYATAIGYKPLQKNISIPSLPASLSFALQLETKKLNTVVVTAAKPLLRQDDDKTIVEPEQLAATSTNAYEIIEKVPGIFMDPDGNIYLNSTTPAQVYINGREQRMSAADIATMLKNLPPNAIASIEIMRTPSARYDASGGGGVVNVVLRKGVKIGLTGSVTLGGNQGRYGNQFVGFNLNNNNGALTTYLNLQVGRRNSYDQLRTNRTFSVDSLLSQNAFTKYQSHNYYIGFGFNYLLNKNWELSYDGRFSYNAQNNNSNNQNLISKITTGQQVLTNVTNVNNKGYNYNITNGLNLKYKIDSLGSEWSTDVSYSISPSHTDQFFVVGQGDLNNRLQFFTAQTNLVKKLQHKITVETGLKTTGVSFRNTTDYFLLNNGSMVKDNRRTGAYRYQENIHSAYAQASKGFGGFILKAGTRVENTRMQGRQLVPKDTSFGINRTDFFPYVYLSRNIMQIAGYDLRAYLVYRRTIARPGYEYLNPTQRFIDPFLYETGNPQLRPQFTQNYEANVSVDERPLIAFGINETKDIFTQVVYTSDTTGKVSFRTYDNLGKNRETYFRLMGGIPPGGKYFFWAGGQYNRNNYQGFYEGKPFTFNRGTWFFFLYQQLKISANTQFSSYGFVRLRGQQQFYELGTFGQLNANLTQQFFKRKLVLTLSMNDIFFTNNNEFRIRQGTIDAYGDRVSDTRRFGVNLRYNFGFRKKEEARQFGGEENPQTP